MRQRVAECVGVVLVVMLLGCGGGPSGSAPFITDPEHEPTVESCKTCLTVVDPRPPEPFRVLVTDREDTHVIVVEKEEKMIPAAATGRSDSKLLNAALGPWVHQSSPSIRYSGFFGDDVVVGVAVWNGVTRSYAVGPSPTSLGSATYQGRMVGISDNRYVHGSMEMTVDIEALTGTLAFTDLSIYGYDASVPHDSHSEEDQTMFLDGDLSYDLAIDGYVFTETGGDDGSVTGSFFGERNMGGILQRQDLNAAFAGASP